MNGDRQPLPPFPAYESPGRRFSRRFIEGNYFYIFSALLMMLGCKLLMRSPALADTEFYRTIQTLLILQGYEMLLIATAVVIVRRLRIVGDAFTLFAIELVLLLDPTFFSNSFHTMVITTGSLSKSLGVNFLCFAVAPVKLAILVHVLGIRLSRRGWTAFLLAMLFVYLAEFPLVLRHDIYVPGYYYALGWMPFVIALILPSAREIASPGVLDELYSPRQRTWLPRLFAIGPLAVVAAHYIESAPIHGVVFLPYHVSPLLLLLVPLIVNNASPEEGRSPRLFGIDALAAMALFLSLSGMNETEYAKVATLLDVTSEVVHDPEFHRAGIPLIVCAGLVMLSYFYYWAQLRDRRALHRIAVLAGAGVIYWLGRHGIIGRGADAFVEALGALFDFLVEHRLGVLVVVWVGLVALAVRFRHAITWFAAGVVSIYLLFRILPDYSDNIVPEVTQAVMILLAVLWARFSDRRGDVLFCAAVVLAVAFLRHVSNPEWWKLAIFLAELIAAGAIAAIVRSRAWAILAASGAVLLILHTLRAALARISLEVAIIIVALVLFAIGVLVTFQKQRILAWLAPKPMPEPPPDMSLGPWPAEPLDSRPPPAPEPPKPPPAEPPASPPSPISTPPPEQPPVDAAAPPPEPEPQPVPPPEPPDAPHDPALVRKLLAAVFIQEAQDGIFVGADKPLDVPAEVEKARVLLPGEQILVGFVRIESTNKPWLAMLTTRRVIMRSATEWAPQSIAYGQIASISRQFGNVAFRGHTGQLLWATGLTAKQAQVLKTGLEIVLAELAFDQQKKAEE